MVQRDTVGTGARHVEFVDPILICGLPIHPLTMSESLDAAERFIETGQPHQHVVLNAAKVVAAHKDPELAKVIANCALINADGQSLVWASRLLGKPLPERVAGIDFMLALWERAREKRYRVYLLGAKAGVLETVAERARDRGVDVVGCHDGYWTSGSEPSLVQAIRTCRADILFIAIPSPKKEEFLSRHLAALGVPLAVGVGGSFDVVAGVTKRAPVWMQRSGLEWMYRLAQEPRRMFTRYLIGNTCFAAIVFRYWIGQRFARIREARTGLRPGDAAQQQQAEVGG